MAEETTKLLKESLRLKLEDPTTTSKQNVAYLNEEIQKHSATAVNRETEELIDSFIEKGNESKSPGHITFEASP